MRLIQTIVVYVCTHRQPSISLNTSGASRNILLCSLFNMQFKCRVRKRFVHEPGIRERYEHYIAKAVIDGTVNYTAFAAIHSTCALPELNRNTTLFNLLHTLNVETRGCVKKDWNKIP